MTFIVKWDTEVSVDPELLKYIFECRMELAGAIPKGEIRIDWKQRTAVWEGEEV